MDGESFIRELCIALEHRWKPKELFLLVTAYFDEADTHGSAPSMVMAGFLGHARQWEIFGRKIRALGRKENFEIFHAKEAHGWRATKGMRVIGDITGLVKEHLTEGMCIKIDYDIYKNNYRLSDTPKGNISR